MWDMLYHSMVSTDAMMIPVSAVGYGLARMSGVSRTRAALCLTGLDYVDTLHLLYVVCLGGMIAVAASSSLTAMSVRTLAVASSILGVDNLAGDVLTLTAFAAAVHDDPRGVVFAATGAHLCVDGKGEPTMMTVLMVVQTAGLSVIALCTGTATTTMCVAGLVTCGLLLDAGCTIMLCRIQTVLRGHQSRLSSASDRRRARRCRQDR